jgi:hypothetical protein
MPRRGGLEVSPGMPPARGSRTVSRQWWSHEARHPRSSARRGPPRGAYLTPVAAPRSTSASRPRAAGWPCTRHSTDSAATRNRAGAARLQAGFRGNNRPGGSPADGRSVCSMLRGRSPRRKGTSRCRTALAGRRMRRNWRARQRVDRMGPGGNAVRVRRARSSRTPWCPRVTCLRARSGLSSWTV